MKFFIYLFFIINTAFAYTPTVESLFRHGSNPEVTTNALSIGLKVTDLADASQSQYYKIYFSVFDGHNLKVSQTAYNQDSFSEGSLQHKFYQSHLTPIYFKNHSVDKAAFYSLIHSILLNDGQFMVDYLKIAGIPVRHNRELLNSEKIGLMKEYKQYLVSINGDRSLKKSMTSPLRPEGAVAQEKADKLLNEPMYLDTNQVKLSSFEGKPAWHIQAGDFQSYISFEERRPIKFKLKTAQGEVDIHCLDYWRPDAAHAIPKKMIIKTSKGEIFQVETLSLRHYNEKEDDLVKRLRHWDEILRSHKEIPARPDFLF